MKEEHLYSSGTSQQERSATKFALDQVPVDGKSDADFFNFVYQFAQSVIFWNENNNIGGDWQRFFGHDITFLLATLKLKDLSAYPVFFHKVANAYEASSMTSEQELLQTELLAKILEIGEYLTNWCTSIQSFDNTSDHKAQLQLSVGEVIQSNIWQGYQDISDCFQGMVYIYQQNPNDLARQNLRNRIYKAQTAIDTILNQNPGPSTPESIAAKASEFSSYDQIWSFLVKLYESLYRTLNTLQQQTEQFVEQSLLQNDHAPQIALLFSLLDMMAPLKEKLNSFSKQHLDFYFKQVLLQQPKEGRADTVPVHFVLNPNHTKSTHVAGTTVVAPKGTDKEPLHYKTTKPLTVTAAQPASFKTIYNGLANKNLAAAAAERIYAAPEANSSDGFGAKLNAKSPSWPTVGSNLSHQPPALKAKQLARLGWAISSPLLSATDGQRTISIFWKLPSADLKMLTLEMAELGYSDPKDVLAFLKAAFNISYTSPKAWVEVKQFEVSLSNASLLTPSSTDQKPAAPTTSPPDTPAPKLPNSTTPDKSTTAAKKDNSAATQQLEHQPVKEPNEPPKTGDKKAGKSPATTPPAPQQDKGNTGHPPTGDSTEKAESPAAQDGLLFTLQIAPTQPAISDYSPKIHQDNYDTTWPVIRFTLNQNPRSFSAVSHSKTDAAQQKSTPINPYALLKDWTVGAGSLRINVSGAQSFVFQNDFSLLKPKAPIAPFGVKPLQGNNFYLGNPEIFCKPLSAFSLKIHWFDLPQFLAGFCEYYLSYNKAYPDKPFYNSLFQLEAALLVDKKWEPLKFKAVPPPKKTLPHTPDSTAGQKTQPKATPAAKTTIPSKPEDKTTDKTAPQSQPVKPPVKSSPPARKHDHFHELLDHFGQRVKHLEQHFLGHKPTPQTPPTPPKEEVQTPTTTPPKSPHDSSLPQPPQTTPPLQEAPDFALSNAMFQWKPFPVTPPQDPTDQKDKGKPKTGDDNSQKPKQTTSAKPEKTDSAPHKSEFHQVAHKAVSDFKTVLGIIKKAGEVAQSGEGLFAPVKSFVLNQASKNALVEAKAKPLPTPPAKDHSKEPPVQQDSTPPPAPNALPICPHKDEGQLLPYSEFTFDLKNKKWPLYGTEVQTEQHPLKFTDHVENGFLKFELTQPAYAFGHEEYPRVVAKVANENMVTIARQLKSGAFPNDPPLPAGVTALHEKGSPSGTKGSGGTGSLAHAIPSPVKKAITNEVNHWVSTINPLAGLVLKQAEKIHVGKILGHIAQRIHAHHEEKKKEKEAATPHAPQGKAKTPPAPQQSTEGKTTTGGTSKPKGALTPSQAFQQLTTSKSPHLLLPPRKAYTPQIKHLEASYQAEIDFEGEDINAAGKALKLFHLQPFSTVSAQAAAAQFKLLPAYAEMGYLYIGIEKIEPPELFSLLFELDESTGDRDLPLPEVTWSYFSSGRWIPFSPLAVEDGTRSFTESGIVELQLPKVSGPPPFPAAKPKQPSLYWVRAAIPQYANAVCETQKVYPHAILAQREQTAKEGEKTAGASQAPTSLKPQKITKLKDGHAAIVKVVQPVASKGGKAPENENEMYVRASERLRHKGRAITPWDYEHLVLEAFPDIGFVRCLSHSAGQTTMAPGHIKVVILPAKLPKTKNKLSPKTAPALRTGISDYLTGLADPFAKIEVINPRYEFLLIEAEIRLQAGLDEGKALNRLNNTLVEQIASWAQDPWTINPFRHSFSYYSLLSIISQDEAVIEVFHFELYLQGSDPDQPPKQLPATFERIQAANPWSIVSSVEKHELRSTQSILPETALILPAKPATKSPVAAPKQSTATDQANDKVNSAEGQATKKTQTPETATTQAKPAKEKDAPPVKNALYIRSDWYKT